VAFPAGGLVSQHLGSGRFDEKRRFFSATLSIYLHGLHSLLFQYNSRFPKRWPSERKSVLRRLMSPDTDSGYMGTPKQHLHQHPKAFLTGVGMSVCFNIASGRGRDVHGAWDARVPIHLWNGFCVSIRLATLSKTSYTKEGIGVPGVPHGSLQHLGRHLGNGKPNNKCLIVSNTSNHPETKGATEGRWSGPGETGGEK